MKTQFDHMSRVVSLENLTAMCDLVSGVMCHKFWIESVSANRVKVGYSNKDEWANDHPMYAVFPCYGDKDNPSVVLEYIKVERDSWDGEGWQAFEGLRHCPQLWRDPDGETWKEIKPE